MEPTFTNPSNIATHSNLSFLVARQPFRENQRKNQSEIPRYRYDGTTVLQGPGEEVGAKLFQPWGNLMALC